MYQIRADVALFVFCWRQISFKIIYTLIEKNLIILFILIEINLYSGGDRYLFKSFTI